MPALSPTMTEGNLSSWIVKEGQEVSAGQVLCEIETDKATLEMESPEDGYLAKILSPEGSQAVQVGTVIAVIAENEEDVGKFSDFSAGAAPAAPKEEAKEEPPSQPPSQPASQPSQAAPSPSAPPAGGRIFASPKARKIAEDRGVSLDGVSGTGFEGRIVAEDVLNLSPSNQPAAAQQQAQPQQQQQRQSQQPSPAAQGNFTDIPNDNVRKIIASRLLESKQTVPHYYLSVDVKMDELLKVRAKLNKENEGVVKVSVNDFIVKAAALALRQNPVCNSSWHGDFIRRHHNVDVCVAVDTGAGLITPIIKSADKRGLGSISETVKDLADRAKANKLKPEEYQGGTFTVSNLGMYGIKNFSAIINPPQSCILAIGAAEKRVVLSESSESGYEHATMMNVTMSCDHRVVDGAVGAQWLKSFRGYMENPLSMLL